MDSPHLADVVLVVVALIVVPQVIVGTHLHAVLVAAAVVRLALPSRR